MLQKVKRLEKHQGTAGFSLQNLLCRVVKIPKIGFPKLIVQKTLGPRDAVCAEPSKSYSKKAQATG
jgi:hypothetical protein